jgi:hypothetical protein
MKEIISVAVVRLDRMLEKAKWFRALDKVDRKTCQRTISCDLQEGFATGNWTPFQRGIEAWERKKA